MTHEVSISDASRHLDDYVSRVAESGDRFVLLRGTDAVAELRPVQATRRLGELPELLSRLPRLTVEEAEGFTQDLRLARSELIEETPPNPWES